MEKYSIGTTGVELKGTGGTWKVIDSHHIGLLLWESEKYGDAAGKILTEENGNIIYKGISGFNDFIVQVYISQKEKELARPVNNANSMLPAFSNNRSTIKKKKKPKNSHYRESVLKKLHEYQAFVDNQKKIASMSN